MVQPLVQAGILLAGATGMLIISLKEAKMSDKLACWAVALGMLAFAVEHLLDLRWAGF